MTERPPLKIRAAVWAGTLVRVGRRPVQLAGRVLPGLGGAVLGSVGVGEVVGHVAGRGLAPWVACVVGAGFLIRIGAEINAAPRLPAVRHDED